ncbi:hypothetical protein BH23ACT3_BH23ACT3_01310 [soil metagenome]
MLKRAYVWVMWRVRHVARATGLLGPLDRWADRSRIGLWLRTLLSIYDFEDLRTFDVPWWTLVATRTVEEHLERRTDASVFEWGSGASTHWLAARCTHLMSVEHELYWAVRVGAELPDRAEVVVVEPDKLAGAEHAARSSKRGFTRLDFSRYVAAIDECTGPFDVIVIDGRAREACLTAAVRHLAPDGIIVFDDIERRRYRRAIAQVPSLQVRWTFGVTPCVPYPAGTALLRHGHRPPTDPNGDPTSPMR